MYLVKICQNAGGQKPKNWIFHGLQERGSKDCKARRCQESCRTSAAGESSVSLVGLCATAGLATTAKNIEASVFLDVG